MRDFIRIALFIVNITSFICLAVVGLFTIYCELFGYDKGNILLENINFPLDDNGITVMSYIFAAILIFSMFIRIRFLDKKQ